MNNKQSFHLTEKQEKSLSLAIFNAKLHGDHTEWPKRFDNATLKEIKEYSKILFLLDEAITCDDYKLLRKTMNKYFAGSGWELLPYKIQKTLYDLAERNGWFK